MLKQLRWKITGLIMGVVVILLTAIFLALYSSTALSYRNRSMEAMRTALQQNQSGQLKPGQVKPQNQVEPQPDSTQPPKQEQNSSLPDQSLSETPAETPPEKPQNEPISKTNDPTPKTNDPDPSLSQPKNTDSPPPPRQEISAVAVVELGTQASANGTQTNETTADEVPGNTDTEETNIVLENHIPALSDEDAITFALLAEKEEKDCGSLNEQHLRYMRQKTPQGSVRYALSDTFSEDHALKTQMLHSGAVALLALVAFFVASCLLSRRLVAPVETAWKQQQQFVADASHELKTPLTVILSNTSLLLRDYDDRKNRNPSHIGIETENAGTEQTVIENRDISHMDIEGENTFSSHTTIGTAIERTLRIQSEATRMKQLVESLLLLARSDSGRLSQDYHNVDFSYLAESSVMAFEPVAFESGREIEAELAEDIELYGNETRLRQLADILIDNACKYSNPGSVIQVQLSEKKDKHTVLFSVTSEGKPLNEEEQKQIFLRFYRADPSRGEIPGFGLGLSIASSIVKEHGGTIQVSSDGIQKNTFTVTLPKKKEASRSDSN